MYYNNRSRNRSRSNSYHGNGNRGGFRRPKRIDHNLFIQKAFDRVEDVYVSMNTFNDFALENQLKHAITSRGYTTPTPIQDQTIPILLEGRDVVGVASTGTGKTGAFLIPLINKVLKNREERVLIVAPTRELAVQIRDELSIFTPNMGIYSTLCIGGVSIGPQIQRLEKNPHFVIGTPGRLRDLDRHRKIRFNRYTSIVLDEVDRMLDMGFIHDVSYIISQLGKNRQSLFFSATMPKNVESIMREFLVNPVTVTLTPSQPSKNVDQDIIRLESGENKIDKLHELLIQREFEKVLVFGRTKWGMEKLTKELDDRGFKVASIHGNKTQAQRQKAIDLFKTNRIRVLLATDVASRGLDIDNVTHVINFDQPESYEDYIHRIGRTGRAGKKGVALTFID